MSDNIENNVEQAIAINLLTKQQTWIPGFRTRIWWKMIIAILCYGFLLIFLLSLIAISHTWLDFGINFLTFIISIFPPLIYLSNCFQLRNKLFSFLHKSFWLSLVMFLIISFICGLSANKVYQLHSVSYRVERAAEIQNLKREAEKKRVRRAEEIQKSKRETEEKERKNLLISEQNAIIEADKIYTGIPKDAVPVLKELREIEKERVDDYLKIFHTIDSATIESCNKDKKILLLIAKKYNVTKVIDSINFFEKAKKMFPTEDKYKNWTCNDDYFYKEYFTKAIIYPLFKKTFSYEYPLSITVDKFRQLAIKNGYTNEFKKEYNDIIYYFYKDFKISETGEKKGKGDNIWITTDYKNNTISFLISIAQNDISYEDLNNHFKDSADKRFTQASNATLSMLKSQSINSNDFLLAILNQKSVNEIGIFSRILDQKTILNVYKQNGTTLTSPILISTLYNDINIIFIGDIRTVELYLLNLKYHNSKYEKYKTAIEHLYLDEKQIITPEKKTLRINIIEYLKNHKSSIKSSNKSIITASEAETLVNQFIKRDGRYDEGYYHVIKKNSQGYEVGCYYNTDGKNFSGLYAVFLVNAISKEVKFIN